MTELERMIEDVHVAFRTNIEQAYLIINSLVNTDIEVTIYRDETHNELFEIRYIDWYGARQLYTSILDEELPIDILGEYDDFIDWIDDHSEVVVKEGDYNVFDN